MTLSELISSAVTLYNNEVHNKIWNKLDPKDTKLIALTTQLEKLLKSADNQNDFTTDESTSSKPTFKPCNINKEWHKKKGAATVTKKGQSQHWCPKHKVVGQYNGLYITYSLADHDQRK